MQTVSKRELFIRSWELYKKHVQFLFNIGILLFAVQHFIPVLMGAIFVPYNTPYFLFHFAYLFVTTGVSLGVMVQLLRIIREQDINDFSHIFRYFHKVFASISGSFIITFSFVFIGLLIMSVSNIQSEIDIYTFNLEEIIAYIMQSNMIYVAIIYGILVTYLSIKTHFFVYYIIDKNHGPITALKNSFQATNGYEADLFIVWVVILSINFIGILMYGIGLLFTLPYTLLTLSAFYNAYLENQGI